MAVSASHHALLRALVLASALVSAVHAGCAEDAPGPAGSGDPGDGGDGALSLAFRPPTTLTLEPRETRELSVVTSPRGEHTLRFALLSGESSEGPADAALDRSSTRTDATGVGRVTITAPSTPVTFSLRASIEGGPSTTLAVSVSASGFVDLEVHPAYLGNRAVTTWTASVRAGLTCDELAGTPPPDGDLVAEAEHPESPVVQEVPVGRVLAVTARAGHYIGGCTTLTQVDEGERNRVVVPVADRPVRLGQTAMGLSFGLQTVSPEWEQQMEAAREHVLTALLGSAAFEVGAVLDAMREGVPESERAAFDLNRSSGQWDSELQQTYAEESLLRDSAREWMTKGELALYDESALEAVLIAENEDPERAILTLLDVAGHAPSNAGFPESAPAGWSADSHDTVLVGTNLFWSPEQLLTALALGPAQEAFSSATSVGRALAHRLDCGLFASVVLNAATPQGQLYPGCGLSCTTAACKDALDVLWQRGRDSGSEPLPRLSLSASATALVGDGAEILELNGSWVALFSADAQGATATGPFFGSALE